MAAARRPQPAASRSTSRSGSDAGCGPAAQHPPGAPVLPDLLGRGVGDLDRAAGLGVRARRRRRSLVSVVQLAPAVVVAPLASGLGDRSAAGGRWPSATPSQAMSMLLTALALALDAPFVVRAGGALVTCAVALTRPVHNATLPSLVAARPPSWSPATPPRVTAEGIGGFLGPLICGVLLGRSDPGRCSCCSACPARRRPHCVVPCRQSPRRRTRADRATASWRRALDGFRELRTRPASALLLGMVAGQYVVVGAMDILLHRATRWTSWAPGPRGRGCSGSAVGVGAVLGARGVGGARRPAPPGTGPRWAACWSPGYSLSAAGPRRHVAGHGALLLARVRGRQGVLRRRRADAAAARGARTDVLARVFGVAGGS